MQDQTLVKITLSPYQGCNKCCYAILDLEDNELYIDVYEMPELFFSACHMGEPIRMSLCGPNNEERPFVNARWIIKNSSDYTVVKAVRKRMEEETSRIEEYIKQAKEMRKE